MSSTFDKDEFGMDKFILGKKKKTSKYMTTTVGTPFYVAPEVMAGKYT